MANLPAPAARRLEGKVAIITGGASGIGECTAKLFASHGAKVVIADIQDDLGPAVCEQIGTDSATYIHCDIRDEEQVKNLVDSTVEKYGKLDIMYNNAGIVDHLKPSILDDDLAVFENVIKTNLIGPFLGTKHAARAMIPARKGSMINTASIAGIIGGCTGHAYTSAKHGVVGLTKNTAVELGQYGIRVNCISPHVTSTPLARNFFNLDEEGVKGIYTNLKGCCSKVEDVAHAALYLASEDAKFISGHNIPVDGGFTIMNTGLCVYGEDLST